MNQNEIVNKGLGALSATPKELDEMFQWYFEQSCKPKIMLVPHELLAEMRDE